MVTLAFKFNGSTFDRLYNNDILPVVFEQGSLGASGDLAPLAHLSLPLLGLGDVYYKGQKRASKSVLEEMGWDPISLKSKEGLALINGTQFMSAYALHILFRTLKVSYLADVISAISLDALIAEWAPSMRLYTKSDRIKDK